MKTIREADISGKRVLVRCDFNVPLDQKGRIADFFRIRQGMPTLHYLLSKNAKLILLSHLGNPGGEVKEDMRLDAVRDAIAQGLHTKVKKVSSCIGEEVATQVAALQNGDVLLLENVRFYKGEQENDIEFAKEIAKFGDIYVNDSFSTSHRNHATLVQLPSLLPAFAGLLLEREVLALEHFIRNPRHPFIAIVGGEKASDKLSFMNAVARNADFVLLGNLLAQEISRQNLTFEHPEKIILPVDGVPGNGKEYDIGPKTEALFKEKLKGAKSVFWVGPLGWTEQEPYGAGSLVIAHEILKSGAFAVTGGGHLSAFLVKNNMLGKFSYVSTGGGATIAFLSGAKLPGLEALGYYANANI